jgi:cytochrome c oxidase subunit 2
VASTPAPATATVTPAAPATVAAALPAKVYFASGQADVDAKGREAIAAAATWLKGESARKVAITGYTDRTGSAEINAELSKRRALAVRAALETAGVAQDRIVMEKPVFVEAGAGGSDAEGRRVEISAQ